MDAKDMVIEELAWSEGQLREALKQERLDHQTTREAYSAALTQMHDMTIAMRNMRDRARELRILISGESPSGKATDFDSVIAGPNPASPTTLENK